MRRTMQRKCPEAAHMGSLGLVDYIRQDIRATSVSLAWPAGYAPLSLQLRGMGQLGRHNLARQSTGRLKK